MRLERRDQQSGSGSVRLRESFLEIQREDGGNLLEQFVRERLCVETVVEHQHLVSSQLRKGRRSRHLWAAAGGQSGSARKRDKKCFGSNFEGIEVLEMPSPGTTKRGKDNRTCHYMRTTFLLLKVLFGQEHFS